MKEDGQQNSHPGLQIDLLDPVKDVDSSNDHGLTKAAVLVPLINNGQGWEILYTRRSNKVLHHKGQVSFPGGMAEPLMKVLFLPR